MAERVVQFSVTAGAPGAGERLDKLVLAELVRQGLDVSRTQIRRLIEDGFVTLDGHPAIKPAMRLPGSAWIEVRIPPAAPSPHQPEDIPLDILFENDDLLVINKPAGMVVHPAAGHFAGTLVNAVLGHDPELEGVGDVQRPGIVHRLDKDTSGLIVVAKSDAAHRELQRQFKEREVEKVYLALLDGRPPTDVGRIEAAIGRDPRNRKRMAIAPNQRGRAAVTEYTVTAHYASHTLVEARPLTGRTHQLRLHFAYLKCPVVGDTVYGRRTPTLPLRRHFLHAARLTLRLPGSSRRTTFEARLPPELDHLLQLLA
ncbi:MAG: RluA family pseudouridine synthase [Anaerolineales bacterium]|nr:RluA family pseudouridine synthase [Anaerolineales bacterium]